MNKRVAYLYILTVFFVVGFYLFGKGEVFGIERYKHSKNMYGALKAAYRMGYEDAKAGRSMDWDGE